MDELTGWLFDLYEHPERGIVIWVISDQGERLRLRVDLPITFYAAGDFKLLRAAWIFLRGKAILARTHRRDLFTGERDVMSVTLDHASSLIHEIQEQFPDLDYYDADVPVSLRFIARTGVHLLGRCRIALNGEWVLTIEPLDSPWETSSPPIPLRVMEIKPGTDPNYRLPDHLVLVNGKREYAMSMQPLRPFLISLQADLIRFDPDLILTHHGDAWLFPKLIEWSRETGLGMDVNRDRQRNVLTRGANSYFAYGQVIHRGAQSHLFGRWHIDRKNAMLFNEYGLEGVLEQARVTGIGV